MHSDGKKTLLEFLPLKYDPTPEEWAEMLKEAKVEQEKKDEKYARQVLAEFKRLNLK